MLNEYFLKELKALIPDEFEDFLKCYELPMRRALRINVLKSNFRQIINEIQLKSVTPFDADTFYIDSEDKLGKHPFHIGGLFYLQEPSATMAVNALNIQKNDKVLDLCAAPGGKSTQILSALDNSGLLWSNEISRSRAQRLLSNLERWGSDNYILSSMSAEELALRLKGYFDKVLVDAPCSGAAMFKKYPDSVPGYSEGNVLACQNRQLRILEEAYKMLREGGSLVYSTCTFNTRENEEVIDKFLRLHPAAELTETGLSCGRSGFENNKVRRCFPMDGGEGHFVARMVRKEANDTVKLPEMNNSENRIVREFIEENLKNPIRYTLVGNNAYASAKPLIMFKGKIIRQGVLLGNIEKQRLEPHHHAFVALMNQSNFKNTVDLNAKEAESYLRGNSLPINGYKGYVQLRYENHPFAFGKGDGRQIKNRLPKGLRKV